MNGALPRRTEILDLILDRVHPPVARFRIISSGLARNHTIMSGDDISGTRACLSCGNCVDACPVVASKPGGTMFVQTSMLLEHVVADECRRCYRCVASCPQVSRPVKDYVRGFRRVERASHWDLLVSYLVLMVTGIVINHWGTGLPGDLRFYLGAIHRLFTVGLIAAPLVWFAFDRHHFRLAARTSVTWTSADMLWARDTARWIASWGRHGAVRRGAFNPGQRFWYIYVPSALAVFAVTGAIKWLGPGVAGDAAVGLATVIHVGLALATDLLLLLHVYLKLVLPVLRDSVRGARQYIEGRDRQRATAPAREG